MSDHDDGHAEAGLYFEKQVHDGCAGGGIEIAGGLIGEKNFWAIDECASDGGALLFAAGKFGGAMRGAFIELDALESFGDARIAFAAIDFGEAKRQLDVFRKRHTRKQIERLKDHADGVAAVAREFERREFGEITAVGVDCAGGRAVETGHEIEQSGFAGAGAAKKGDKVAGADVQRNIVDSADGGGAESIVTRDAIELDGGRAGMRGHG